MRHFIHHPTDTPIEVNIACAHGEETPSRSSSSGVGGLAFMSKKEISPGTLVQIKIPYPRIKSEFIIDAKVVWCRKRAHGVALGIEFQNEDDAFHVRMLEQSVIFIITGWKSIAMRAAL